MEVGDAVAMLGRGVWVLPCLGPWGDPVMFAIDSRSRIVALATYRPDAEAGLRDALAGALDAVDPEEAKAA